MNIALPIGSLIYFFMRKSLSAKYARRQELQAMLAASALTHAPANTPAADSPANPPVAETAPIKEADPDHSPIDHAPDHPADGE